MIETIRKVYDEINAMGGRPDQDNSYDQGIVDTVAKVLEILEREFPALAPDRFEEAMAACAALIPSAVGNVGKQS